MVSQVRKNVLVARKVETEALQALQATYSQSDADDIRNQLILLSL